MWDVCQPARPNLLDDGGEDGIDAHQVPARPLIISWCHGRLILLRQLRDPIENDNEG